MSEFLTELDALIVRVEQKGAKAVGDVVIGQELQVILTELKLHRELEVDLRKHAAGPGQSCCYTERLSCVFVNKYQPLF